MALPWGIGPYFVHRMRYPRDPGAPRRETMWVSEIEGKLRSGTGTVVRIGTVGLAAGRWTGRQRPLDADEEDFIRDITAEEFAAETARRGREYHPRDWRSRVGLAWWLSHYWREFLRDPRRTLADWRSAR